MQMNKDPNLLYIASVNLELIFKIPVIEFFNAFTDLDFVVPAKSVCSVVIFYSCY